MSTTLASFRRLTVAIALSGITAIGAVALAPAAMADETPVVQSAPVVESAPESAPVSSRPPWSSPPRCRAPRSSSPPAPRGRPRSGGRPGPRGRQAPAAACRRRPSSSTRTATSTRRRSTAPSRTSRTWPRRSPRRPRRRPTDHAAAAKLLESRPPLRAPGRPSRPRRRRELLNGVATRPDARPRLLDQQAQKLIDKASEKTCRTPRSAAAASDRRSTRMSGGAPRPGRRRQPEPHDLNRTSGQSLILALFLRFPRGSRCGSPWIVIRCHRNQPGTGQSRRRHVHRDGSHRPHASP